MKKFEIVFSEGFTATWDSPKDITVKEIIASADDSGWVHGKDGSVNIRQALVVREVSP